MFSNEELKTIHKSLDDYITDYEEMDSTKIAPIIFKIEDILTNRGVFINSACDS
jgi:hypothetical protein